jgi:YHS domain-containing protein/thiol-disulfide isomerase/thioredoxin
MKPIVQLWSLGVVLLATALAAAQDQVPWVADFRTACGMAAEQHRLVLLHFYNENCGPCVRLDQNVFSKPEVGEAVAQNYIAVKVHAGKNPQLAGRYRVNQWPTDVFVTAAGLEVYRTISPKEPADYIGLLHQVAQQTGVGAARQWKTQMAQAAESLAAEKQRITEQAQQRWSDAGRQYQNAADQARVAAGQGAQYVSDAAQQAQQRLGDAAQQASGAAAQWTQQANSAPTQWTQQAGAAPTQWTQQTGEAVQRYEQQAGDAYRQFREQAGQASDRAQQQVQATRQEWRAAGQQARDQLADAAGDIKRQFTPATSGSPYDRRSAFIPADPSPAASPPAATPGATISSSASTSASLPSAGSPSGTSLPGASPSVAAANNQAPPLSQFAASPSPPSSASPSTSQPAAPSSAPPASSAPPSQPQMPTNNPWVVSRPAETANALAAALGGSPNQPQSSNSPVVPASQAPPIALEGFCPVTLLETVARDPADRAAWKKGDRRFGAIHRGRTYLFASAEQQQKFLANPDAYAPVLAGCDPVRYAERGEVVDGKRAYGLVTPDRRIFLFADETSRNRFEQAPAAYSNAIQQAMLRSDSGNLYR